ncbi:hypothetical protein K3552_05525 [Leisingera aquaemixtae]|uniref:tetratricopeptide repeat protein n=1 Tax=Leisingera aquaemixtae TaxID=1396826 RepID=UPI0021A7A8AF|nr:hypothetical protein [Leisingera aquaemixtae]UWQ38469.1 hypothetical protein K3552_05525 [Leisingera aquaemixtae]
MYASIQISKPTDEQVLERGPVELFKRILSDPNTNTYGTRGNAQQGVDIVGKRDGDPEQYVGVQCKLKKEERVLTEKIVRDEVFEALKFEPELTEFFIITTAPDSASIQQVARKLEVEIKKKHNRMMSIQVWGWDTLQREIQKYSDVTKIFLPDYTPHSEAIQSDIARIALGQDELSSQITERFDRIEAKVETSTATIPSVLDTTALPNGLERHIDKEIDSYREIANSGKPADAANLLSSLSERLPSNASGRIQFRLKANIASCLFGLAKEDEAISLLFEACAHAPDEPKAKTNLAMAYLLQGKWEKTIEICEKGLKDDPTNQDLAGYLVQARRFDQNVSDPLSGIPDTLISSKSVQIGYLFFLRQREVTPGWWTLASELLQRFPSDEFIIQAAAEATVDRVLTEEKVVNRHQVAQTDIEALNDAKERLSGLWRDFTESQKSLRVEYLGLATNLVLCCDLLGDIETLERLLDQHGEELLADDAFAVRAAQMSFNYNQQDLFKRVLPYVTSAKPKFHFDFYHALEIRDWDQISMSEPNIESLAEEHEKELFRVAVSVAKKMTFAGQQSAEDFLSLRPEIKTDFRGYVLLLNAMDDKGFSVESEEVFQEAAALIAESGGPAARSMFAHYAYKRRDWYVICRVLEGNVDTAKDNDELRLLATAYVSTVPATRSAVRFFNELSPTVKSNRFFIEREAVFHFNRGALRQAEDCYRRAIAASETPELGYYVPLLSLLLRAQKHEATKAVIDEVIQADPVGQPEEKSTFAHILMSHGYPERAVSTAYEAVCEAEHSAEVHSAFCTLILMNTRLEANERVVPSVSFVQPNAWVRLENQNGESFDFLISKAHAEPSHLFQRVFPPDHAFVAQCTGEAVGFEFQAQRSLNTPPVSWKVVEIQHKFGRACRLIMDEFSERFPESKLMGSLQTIGEDAQPILDFVKDHSRRIRTQADFYVEQGFPISVVAALLNSSSIEFAHNIRAQGYSIAACHGNDAERQEAFALIEAKREQGAVIDAYTAWTISTLGAFDTIKKVFGRIRLARSCFDEITKLLVEAESKEADSFSLHWKDGQFFRDEMTAEQLEPPRLCRRQVAWSQATIFKLSALT